MDRYEIDRDVAEAAERIAAERNELPGKVISDLARHGLGKAADRSSMRASPPPLPPGVVMKDGLPLILSRGGPKIPSDEVRQLIIDSDLEDAALR